MTDQAHARKVANWLNDLATLTAGNIPLSEFKERVATMTGVVADTFPDPATFTKASVVAVAEECRFWPAYSDLAKSLGAWWDKNRPSSTWTLPAEYHDAPPDPQRWLNAWVNQRGKTEADIGYTRARLLHLIRLRSGAVYEYLLRVDTEAADIAVRLGWREIATPEKFAAQAKQDWADPVAVRASVARILETYPEDTPHHRGWALLMLKLLRAAVARHAPENEALVRFDFQTDEEVAAPAETPPVPVRNIDEARAEAARAFEATHGRKPGELHPATLAAMRDATPSVQRARSFQAMKPPANDTPPAPKPPNPPDPPTDLRLRRALAWGDDP